MMPADNKIYATLLGGMLLVNSSELFADDDLFFDMPIVLSANRLEQPVSSAAISITIIDRETIEASGARTIPEVLRLVPGMQVGYSGNEFGDEPQYVVTYHGHSDQYSKQMQVLIDGRSIYEPVFGGINWKSIPVNINDIERIEVSRGPNLATYGSNSFQAAINIITRTAAEDQGFFVQANAGERDIADLTLRHGGSSGKLDYRITLSTLNDAGFESANEFDYTDDSESNNIDYRLDYQLDNQNTLSYQGGYGEHQQQTERNHSGAFPLSRTVDNTHFFQFLKWENVIDQKNTLLIQYYYNLSKKEDFSSSDVLNFPPFDAFTLDINGDIKSERHNLELTHFLQPDENLKLSWGISAQTDLAESALYLDTNDTLKYKQFRVFANAEWHIDESNIINAGALIEKNDFTDTELSPRLSYTHAFNKQHRIRFGVSEAVRSPFIYEERGNLLVSEELVLGGTPTGTIIADSYVVGNDNLENEKIISREIVYFGNFLNSSLLFNARLFHDRLYHFIGTTRRDVDPASDDNVPDNPGDFGDPNASNTVPTFDNHIESTTNGLELELDYHVDTSLRLIASGAIINISSETESIRLSAPQHSFSFIGSKQFNEKYSGSLGYYYVDAFKWTDARGVDDDASTDKYNTLDIRLSRHFRLNQANAKLSVVVKNLLDDYSDYQGQPSEDTAPVVIQNTTAYIDFRMNF